MEPGTGGVVGIDTGTIRVQPHGDFMFDGIHGPDGVSGSVTVPGHIGLPSVMVDGTAVAGGGRDAIAGTIVNIDTATTKVVELVFVRATIQEDERRHMKISIAVSIIKSGW